MRIFVHRSKTDFYRDGAWVVIAKTFKHTCPYLLVQQQFVAASFQQTVKSSFFACLFSFVLPELINFVVLFLCLIPERGR